MSQDYLKPVVKAKKGLYSGKTVILWFEEDSRELISLKIDRENKRLLYVSRGGTFYSCGFNDIKRGRVKFEVSK